MSDETVNEETIQPNGTEKTAESTPETAELSLEQQLEVAKAEATANLDGWQRARAELANARRRFEKERAEAYPNAIADVAAKLLPVLDDFERALGSIPPDIASNKWFEGIQLVHRKLATIFENVNVVPIETVGHPFNPSWHEALMQEASQQYESGIVVRELQKGYRLGERVVRPALVAVAE